jgi:hypothetical protein
LEGGFGCGREAGRFVELGSRHCDLTGLSKCGSVRGFIAGGKAETRA